MSYLKSYFSVLIAFFMVASTMLVAIPSVESAGTGTISGMVFNDSNVNGAYDAGDSELAGWTIILDGITTTSEVVHLTTTSNSYGNYHFSGLAAGVYSLSQSAMGLVGWTVTYPLSKTYDDINLGDGQTLDGYLFGLVAPGSITVRLIIDLDGDHIWTTDDQYPGVGWTFQLWYYNTTLAAWQKIGERITDIEGYIHGRTNLTLGQYQVVQIGQPGFTAAQTKPFAIITSDQDVLLTFYTSPLGSIQVAKIIDPDGIPSSEDEHLGGAGWEFTVYRNIHDAWAWEATLTTGPSGYTDVLPVFYGIYKIVETPVQYYHNAPDQQVTVSGDNPNPIVYMSNTPPTPSIHVEKSGPSTGVVGETITYVFLVSNDGEVPLSDIHVVDNIAGEATYQSGDTNSNGYLDLTEVWMYQVTYVIQVTDNDPLVNTVTASGKYGSTTVEDTADHRLNIDWMPLLDIDKAADKTSAKVGDVIHYTISVSHADGSDGSPIYDLSVVDSLGTAVYQSGDDGDGILEMGEVWIYTFSYTVTVDTPDPLDNTATASGEDKDGQTVGPVSDSWRVTIDWMPLLDIDKAADKTSAKVGDVIHYTISVSHADGSDGSPIYDLSVVDSLGTAVYQSGDDGDGILEMGEVWIYTFSYTVTVDTPDPLDNTATASGEDKDGQTVGPVSDSWSVEIEKYWWIIVYKYEDKNLNGVYDEGTDALVTCPSFTFQLQMYVEGQGWVDVGDTKQTVDGTVTFEGSGSGQYRVIELLGYDSCGGGDSISCCCGGDDGCGGGCGDECSGDEWRMVDGTSDTFNVQGGETYWFNALNMRCWEIIVYKFEDVNSNGEYDIGVDTLVTCPSFSFQLQKLVNDCWVDVGWEKTTYHGIVTFWGCEAGTYRVIEVLDDGCDDGWDGSCGDYGGWDGCGGYGWGGCSGYMVSTYSYNFMYATGCGGYGYGYGCGYVITSFSCWGSGGYGCGGDTGCDEPETFWVMVDGQSDSYTVESGGVYIFNALNKEWTCYPGGHTIGFWKTNIYKNMCGKTCGIQVTKEQIMLYLNELGALYGSQCPCLNGMTLSQAYSILNVPCNADMQQKAQAQMLALLLTSRLYAPDFGNSYIELPDIGQGSSYAGDGNGALMYLFGLYEEGQYSVVKDLADGLNNAGECEDWDSYWGGSDDCGTGCGSSWGSGCGGFYSSMMMCSFSSYTFGNYYGGYGGDCGGCHEQMKKAMRHEYIVCGGVIVELTMENGAFTYPVFMSEIDGFN